MENKNYKEVFKVTDYNGDWASCSCDSYEEALNIINKALSEVGEGKFEIRKFYVKNS